MMKKILFLFIASIAILGFQACSQDDEVVTAKITPEGVSFTNAPADSYVLTNATRGNLAERFVWNERNFDVPTPVNYVLLSSITSDFTEMDTVGTTTQNNFPVKVSDLMQLATKAGLDSDPETEAPNTGTVYFRVRASIGEGGSKDALQSISEPMALNLVLPETDEEPAPVELPKLYMVGNFLAAGQYGGDWNAADAVPLASSGDGQTDFEGFVDLNVDAPEYKFLPTNKSFDGDYGDTGEENGDFNGTIEEEGEVNCGTPDGTGGYYWVKVNTKTLKYSLTKTDWAIIGDATPNGWDADTDMTYDPATKTWTITTDLVAQPGDSDHGFKFRANDAWDINFGDTDADGSLEAGGTNIAVSEAGNYTIVLDLSDPRNYTYSLTKN